MTEPYRCDDANCVVCDRRHRAKYKCTECAARFFVPGRFVWCWQNRCHEHKPDDPTVIANTARAHFEKHGRGDVVVVSEPGTRWPA